MFAPDFRAPHLEIRRSSHDRDLQKKNPVRVPRRPVDYEEHGTILLGQAERLLGTTGEWQQGEEDDSPGTILTIVGTSAEWPLKLDSLHSMTRAGKKPSTAKYLLLTSHEATDAEPETATVWVSSKHANTFIKIFQDYLTKKRTAASPDRWETPDGNPANRDLVANISALRTARVGDFWTSDGTPPQAGEAWWEIWVETDRLPQLSLEIVASALGARVVPRTVAISGRRVYWVRARHATIEQFLTLDLGIAELRSPSFVDTVEDLDPSDQMEYVLDLVARVFPAPPGSPVVCHLDTGVMSSHRLLRESMDQSPLMTVIGDDGADLDGHGTAMAGLALFGDLERAFLGTEVVQLGHRLESVRILPRRGEVQTDPRAYGSVTIEAVAGAEAGAAVPRVYCMPVTTTPDAAGVPTLWSASVDAMAVGVDVARDGDQLQLLSKPDSACAKLFVISAGNVRSESYAEDFLAVAARSAIEDPAQAWNALTVGAYTERSTPPAHPDYAGWHAVASQGQLSPFSRTSLDFGLRAWPIKPEVCFEGGNLLTDGQDYVDNHPLVSLRTTGNSSDVAVASANATSAASAQCARLAAMIWAEYSHYWPETVRGLIVNSARWTPWMQEQIDRTGAAKQPKLALLRQFGWGVPQERSALSSSSNHIKLVVQDAFTAFYGRQYKMNTLRLHDLPWPEKELLALADQKVRLRVTLSYFVEPSASRRGWRNKFAYASHGLRFELKDELESESNFLRRVSRLSVDEEEGAAGSTPGNRWTLGVNQRNHGSLHQDEWVGTGAQLATCGQIAVFPTGGWWKNNSRKDRLDFAVRYSLIVSLEAEGASVDLYTPVSTLVEVEQAVKVSS